MNMDAKMTQGGFFRPRTYAICSDWDGVYLCIGPRSMSIWDAYKTCPLFHVLFMYNTVHNPMHLPCSSASSSVGGSSVRRCSRIYPAKLNHVNVPAQPFRLPPLRRLPRTGKERRGKEKEKEERPQRAMTTPLSWAAPPSHMLTFWFSDTKRSTATSSNRLSQPSAPFAHFKPATINPPWH